jgi:phasin
MWRCSCVSRISLLKSFLKSFARPSPGMVSRASRIPRSTGVRPIAEIRDLTAKSVEEARKALGSFIEAAHKATAQAEGTANALQSSAKDVSAKALSFTEANLKAAFDHAQKLIQAKDPQEILAHHSEYVKKQLAAMDEHAKELGTAVLKAVTPDK